MFMEIDNFVHFSENIKYGNLKNRQYVLMMGLSGYMNNQHNIFVIIPV